jgi:hypothetical protein
MKSYVASGIACSITVVDNDGRSNEKKTTDNVSSSTIIMAFALALAIAPRLCMPLLGRIVEFSSDVVLRSIPSSGLEIWSPELMASCFMMFVVIAEL